ncbi:TIR domain-containing protein [Streptomyces sp. NPDC004031]
MPDVFINYRTGDGEKSAAVIERELSHRFGSERIFRASKSIRVGSRYPQELLGNLRRSGVVLAVIGESWSTSEKLHDASDWVRREILEALACGIPVVPVLDGRGTERLRAADLPEELREVAEVQSLRLDLQNADADLRRIGDELRDLVPSLEQAEAAVSGAERPAPADGGVQNSTGTVNGTAIQGRDITGDAGTVVKGNHGPVHTGSGDINERHYQGDHHESHYQGNHNEFSGNGSFVAGEHHGGTYNDFGGTDDRKDKR